MKTESNDSDDMREEYDFSDGVRGRYAARFAEGTFESGILTSWVKVQRSTITSYSGASPKPWHLQLWDHIAGAWLTHALFGL